jgi:hypothetical protein
LLSLSNVHFVDTRKGLDASEKLAQITPFDGGALGVTWSNAQNVTLHEEELGNEPVPLARFGTLPDAAGEVASYDTWKKSLADHLYRTRRFELFKSNVLGEFSQPGESARDFRIRLAERAREQRDESLDKLRRKYATKLAAAEDRIHRAEHRAEAERQDVEGTQMQTVVSWGATILSAVLGRKRLSARTVGRVATAAREMGRSRKQSGELRRAEERLEHYEQRLEDLEHEIEQEEQLIQDRFDPLQETLDTIPLRPRKIDIDVRLLALAWIPFVVHDDDMSESLFA